MIYDDGSYDVVVDGTSYAYDTNGAPASSVSPTGFYAPAPAGFSQDRQEQAKLGTFYPPGRPFWENAAVYGFTKAIDAHFGQKAAPTNTNGTYAGADGRTRTQGRLSQEPASDNMMLLLIAGVAIYALVA